MAGCSGRAAQLLASVAGTWAMGPSRQWPGSIDPVCKKLLQVYFRVQKFQKNVRTCKNHRKLSACQKNAYDIPKCSEKHALPVCVKIMHL
jgi:hypothetical protein